MRIIEGEYDDRPLSGPWNRRRPESPGPLEDAPAPAKTSPDPLEKVPGQLEDSPLQGPWGRREDPAPGRLEIEPEPAPTGSRNARDHKTPTFSEVVPQYNLGAAAEKPGPQEENQCPGPGRSRAYINRLLSPAGIYAGIVMAEVLGGRGGRCSRFGIRGSKFG